MKKIVMIAIAMIAISATAQEKEKMDRKTAMKEKMEARKNMTPEEATNAQTERMAKHLDLSENQKKQVHQMLSEQAAERKAKREAFEKNKGKNEKPALTDEQKEQLKKERKAKKEETDAKLKEILSEEQFTKYQALKEQSKDRKHHMKGKRKMHKKEK